MVVSSSNPESPLIGDRARGSPLIAANEPDRASIVQHRVILAGGGCIAVDQVEVEIAGQHDRTADVGLSEQAAGGCTADLLVQRAAGSSVKFPAMLSVLPAPSVMSPLFVKSPVVAGRSSVAPPLS